MHRAKAPEWMASTQENKLATAADWALAVENVKSKVQAANDIEVLKPYAVNLRTCIDEAVPAAPAATDVAMLAAFCVKSMNW